MMIIIMKTKFIKCWPNSFNFLFFLFYEAQVSKVIDGCFILCESDTSAWLITLVLFIVFRYHSRSNITPHFYRTVPWARSIYLREFWTWTWTFPFNYLALKLHGLKYSNFKKMISNDQKVTILHGNISE